MNNHKLYMVLLGCKPEGRFTEQHDIFFGIASSLKELVPQMNAFWPEAKGNLHIDAWREVTSAGNYSVTVISRNEKPSSEEAKLFFLNLGGYKKDEFEEHHHKLLIAGTHSADAIKQAKASFFYTETGFKGAASHVDDKYALDVDDIYNVEEILAPEFKSKFGIKVTSGNSSEKTDQIHLGYLQLWKIKNEY